jgi:hypothetical protein
LVLCATPCLCLYFVRATYGRSGRGGGGGESGAQTPTTHQTNFSVPGGTNYFASHATIVLPLVSSTLLRARVGTAFPCTRIHGGRVRLRDVLHGNEANSHAPCWLAHCHVVSWILWSRCLRRHIPLYPAPLPIVVVCGGLFAAIAAEHDLVHVSTRKPAWVCFCLFVRWWCPC